MAGPVAQPVLLMLVHRCLTSCFATMTASNNLLQEWLDLPLNQNHNARALQSFM